MEKKDFNVTFSLMQMGLSEREAKVYRVLLGVSEITAAAIPKFTDIPRTKVYEALNSLIKKGFCKEQIIGSNGQTYSAIHPQIALNGLMHIEEERMKALKATNSRLIKTLGELFEKNTDRLQDYNFIETHKGRQEIIHRYTEFRRHAKSEILEFSKGDYVMTDEEMNMEVECDAKLVKAGVQIKEIYEIHPEKVRQIDNYYHKKNTGAGLQSRIYPELPIKMSLFDHSIIMLNLVDPIVVNPNLTAVIIEHAGLYSVLRTAFFHYWEKATVI